MDCGAIEVGRTSNVVVAGGLAQALRVLVEFVVEYREKQRRQIAQQHTDYRTFLPTEVLILNALLECHPEGIAFRDLCEKINRSLEIPVNATTISQSLSKLANAAKGRRNNEEDLVMRPRSRTGPHRQSQATETEGLVIRHRSRTRLSKLGLRVAQELADAENMVYPKLAGAAGILDKSHAVELAGRLNLAVRTINSLSKKDEPATDEQSLERASISRVYDYFFGGTYWFPVDKKAAEYLEKIRPDVGKAALANRSFLRRAVTYIVRDCGIKQIIDCGAGLPSSGNTHEIAHRFAPDAQVVYFDSDPNVVSASIGMLGSEPNVHVLLRDVCDTEELLKDAFTKLDPQSPVAIIFAAVLHFVVDDDQVKKIIDVCINKIIPQSMVVLSHGYFPEGHTATGNRILEAYSRLVGKAKPRSKEFIVGLTEKLELHAPGIVFTPEWRPEIVDPYLGGQPPPLSSNPPASLALAAVGKKLALSRVK